MSTPLRTALSLAVHESPSTIVDQCLNNVLVGGFDVIVLHVNINAALDTALLMRLVQATAPLRGRVHLNPTRLATDWVAPGLLHRAHIANFHWLRTQCAFDVFATDASNTLVLRPGLKAHLSAQPMGIDSAPACGWHSAWEDNLRRDPLFAMAGEDCRRNQIEGMFMRAALFAQVVDWIESQYEPRYEAQAAQGQAPEKVPREEYLFATALAQLARPAQGTAYVMMRQGSALGWHDDSTEPPCWRPTAALGAAFGWEPFEIERSLQAERLLPLYWEFVADHVPPIADFAAYKAGKYAIKRVHRSLDDPVRRLVGTHFGYRELSLQARAIEG